MYNLYDKFSMEISLVINITTKYRMINYLGPCSKKRNIKMDKKIITQNIYYKHNNDNLVIERRDKKVI